MLECFFVMEWGRKEGEREWLGNREKTGRLREEEGG
jgi:hypothetical protein